MGGARRTAPAPRASSVTVTGTPTSTQCQKPEPVGASGSRQVTVNPRVAAGYPLQRS